jgi:hypothetical protein
LRVVQVVAVTDHAVARFRERVRPGLGLRDAERELLRVLCLAVIAERRPSWADSHSEVVAWALLGDGIAFPLVADSAGELVVVTCVTRGGASEDVVAARRREKAARRHDRRHNHDDSACYASPSV